MDTSRGEDCVIHVCTIRHNTDCCRLCAFVWFETVKGVKVNQFKGQELQLMFSSIVSQRILSKLRAKKTLFQGVI